MGGKLADKLLGRASLDCPEDPSSTRIHSLQCATVHLQCSELSPKSLV
jgi:hypothetical protein